MVPASVSPEQPLHLGSGHNTLFRYGSARAIDALQALLREVSLARIGVGIATWHDILLGTPAHPPGLFGVWLPGNDGNDHCRNRPVHSSGQGELTVRAVRVPATESRGGRSSEQFSPAWLTYVRGTQVAPHPCKCYEGCHFYVQIQLRGFYKGCALLDTAP
jgi:hypothetical protein